MTCLASFSHEDVLRTYEGNLFFEVFHARSCGQKRVSGLALACTTEGLDTSAVNMNLKTKLIGTMDITLPTFHGFIQGGHIHA